MGPHSGPFEGSPCDKVVLLYGPEAAFTGSLGLSLNLEPGERPKRWSMNVGGNVVIAINAADGILNAHMSGPANLLAPVPA